MTSQERLALFERWKSFLQFEQQDAARLMELGPVVERHGPSITDRFYAQLQNEPETAPFLDGRLDRLKRTHAIYLRSLVGGEYGEQYLESRWRVGMAHVRVGLAPHWVEVTMSSIRTMMVEAMVVDGLAGQRLAQSVGSVVKICDLDLMIINLSYAEDRYERFSHVTGMPRRLIENLISTRRAATYLAEQAKEG